MPNPTRSTVTKRYECRAVFFPPEAGEKDWGVHCLTFDVVTQGRTLKHAVEMVQEACGMVIVEDLSQGLNPEDRKAPQSEWRQYFNAAMHGKRMDALKLSENEATQFRWIADFELEVTFVRDADAPKPKVKKPRMHEQMAYAVA